MRGQAFVLPKLITNGGRFEAEGGGINTDPLGLDVVGICQLSGDTDTEAFQLVRRHRDFDTIKVDECEIDLV